MLVGHPSEVELHREALLEPVAAVDVDRVDPVDRLLGHPDHSGVLARDLGGHGERCLVELIAGDHLEHRAVLHEVGGGDVAAGEVERAHQVRRDHPGQVRGRAQGAAVHLGDPEERVVAGHDAVGVADQADAAAEAEALDRGDDRDRALVDRAERSEAAAVGADQRVEALGGLHLLDVDAGVEALALRAEYDDVGVQVATGRIKCVGEVEPSLHGECVHGWVAHRDDAGAPLVQLAGDAHAVPLTRQPSTCLVLYTGDSLRGPGRPRRARHGRQPRHRRRHRGGAGRGRRARGHLRPIGRGQPGTRHHPRAVRRTRPRGRGVDGRRARAGARPAGRAGEQRRRLAVRPGGGRLAALPRQGDRPEPHCAPGRRPGRERRDAAAGVRRRDREHLVRLRAATLARHRGVRRCQGRRGQPHPVAGRRVGTEGSREHGRRGAVSHRADERSLRRRRDCRCHRGDHPAGPDGRSRPRSATWSASSPPTWRPTSPVPAWSATVAANRLPS